MNVGESARLFANTGEYERRTRNKVVMSGEGKCFVKLEGACGRAIKLTLVSGEQRVVDMGGRRPHLEHLGQERFNSCTVLVLLKLRVLSQPTGRLGIIFG